MTGGYRSYWFPDNTDAIPHLTAIASELGDGTLFTMRYAANFALADPFTGASFGTANLLHELVIPGGRSFQLYYNTGSQELNRVIMPYGGTLQWVYGAKTLAGNRTQMEVTSRILNAQDGQGDKTYTLTHDDAGDLSRLAHSYTTVQDASGAADKSYSFSTAADWKLGLFTALAERKVVSGTPVSTLRSSTATWTQTANGNPYVSVTEEVIDPGVTGVEKASRTEQTVDDHGNLLQRKQYGYYTPGGTPVLARTYTYTYLSSTAYTSRWIWNRPVTVKLQKPGGTLMTLLTNTYEYSPRSSSNCLERNGAHCSQQLQVPGVISSIGGKVKIRKSETLSGLVPHIAGNVVTATLGAEIEKPEEWDVTGGASMMKLVVKALAERKCWKKCFDSIRAKSNRSSPEI